MDNNLFDYDHDGEFDAAEQYVEYKIFEEVTGDNDSSYDDQDNITNDSKSWKQSLADDFFAVIGGIVLLGFLIWLLYIFFVNCA